MILKRIVEPDFLPVTLTECKQDLRVQHSAEDELIDSLIADATDYMDAPNGVIGKALITQTWEISVPAPDRFGRIALPVTPVQSLSSVSFFDNNNEPQAIPVDDFFLYATEDCAVIEPKPGVSWPATFNRRDAITITFVAGYGNDSGSIPNSIRRAIRLLVAHWYENRQAVTDRSMTELPLAVQSLVSINRKGWVS